MTALNDTLGVKRAIRHYDFSMPFWEATRQKKLLIQYCKVTGKYQHFPRPVSIFTGRRRDIEWREVSGKGKVSASSSGVFRDLDVSWARRSEADANGVTSPEELLAAAHAGCFAMSLAGELREQDARIAVTTNVVLDEVEGQGHRIVESQLTVRAQAPGLAQEAFDEAVRAADAGCPFSRLIAAGAKVTIDARLEA